MSFLFLGEYSNIPIYNNFENTEAIPTIKEQLLILLHGLWFQNSDSQRTVSCSSGVFLRSKVSG
jgi:hypothetical protein